MSGRGETRAGLAFDAKAPDALSPWWLTGRVASEILAGVTEAEGCALLLAKFTAGGYTVAENFHFHEDEVEVDLDGWDGGARVGYEYITREAGDHLQFDDATLERFEARMRKGELYVLLVDERDAVTPERLSMAADGFLAEVASRRGAAR